MTKRKQVVELESQEDERKEKGPTSPLEIDGRKKGRKTYRLCDL